MSEPSTPQAIETEGVAHFVEEYRVAARNAIEAGKHTYLFYFNISRNLIECQQIYRIHFIERSCLLE